MSLKNAALFALIGTMVLTVFLAVDFIDTILNVARGLVPAMKLLTSFVDLRVWEVQLLSNGLASGLSPPPGPVEGDGRRNRLPHQIPRMWRSGDCYDGGWTYWITP